MYKLLTILLFWVSLTANSQMIINASNYYRPFPNNYSYLLSLYPTTGFAYSFRKLSSTYSGYCVRVRRSSDNTESSIGFSNNYIDTVSMKSFVGANTGYITIWYDQSGNSYDVSQSTATAQPTIMTSGSINYTNKCVCAIFNGSSNTLVSTSSFSSFGTSVSFSSVVFDKNAGSNYQYQWAVGVTNPTGTKAFISSAAGAYLDWNTYSTIFWGNGYNSTAPRAITAANQFVNNTQNLWFGALNSTANSILLNGNSLGLISTSTANVSSTGGSVSIGASLTGGNYSSEYIQEVVVWQSNQSANSTAIIANIDNFYKVY